MSISDALRISQATGATFARGQWVKYEQGCTYRFSAEEMIADDWEPLTDRDEELAANYVKEPTR